MISLNTLGRSASLLALMLSAGMAVPGHAQTATQEPQANDNSTGDVGLEDIVVTAQFREQNLQDTPIAITAVSGEMLEARSQTNLSQVASQAPNVTLKPQGQSFGPALGASIRGVGQFDFNPALEPGVGVYVDDVYFATLTGSILDLLDLDRVEISRGPQGTLAGKNSIGGAVKLYSKKPVGDGTGYFQAAYGSRDRMDLRGSADFKITDTLFGRVSGVSKKQDGYVKRLDYGCVNPTSGIAATGFANSKCVLADDGDVNFQAVRGQLRYVPSDNFEINLTGDYSIDDRHTPGSVLTYLNYTGLGDINPFSVPVNYNQFFCGKYCNYATFDALPDNGRPLDRVEDRSRFEGYGFSGKVDWKLSDSLALESITAYRAYNAQFTNDDDATPLAHSVGRSDLTFWSFSQELRLNGSFGENDAIEYTLGGFYMKQESVYSTIQNLRYASAPGLLIYGADPVKASTKAAFAHLTWNITDQLSLTGGLRYTDERKTYEFIRKNPDGTPNSAVDGIIGEYDGKTSDRFDYRLNAQYKLTDDIMVYGQFSTGFKGGGVSPRPFAPLQVRSFGPETIESYELGFKSDLFDRLLRFNVAGYYSNYKDIQLSLGSCPEYNPTPPGPTAPFPCALISNAGDATIKGFEVETSLRPAPGLMIDGALSYLDFKYKSGSINPAAGGPTRLAGPQYGDYPAYVPKWKWSIGAQYEILAGDIGSFTPRFDAAYQGDIYANSSNRDVDTATRARNKIDSYIVANGRLTWANVNKDLEVSLEVTNLFDKYYYLTMFDLTPNNAGVAVAQPGRPREWALSAKVKF